MTLTPVTFSRPQSSRSQIAASLVKMKRSLQRCGSPRRPIGASTSRWTAHGTTRRRESRRCCRCRTGPSGSGSRRWSASLGRRWPSSSRAGPAGCRRRQSPGSGRKRSSRSLAPTGSPGMRIARTGPRRRGPAVRSAAATRTGPNATSSSQRNWKRSKSFAGPPWRRRPSLPPPSAPPPSRRPRRPPGQRRQVRRVRAGRCSAHLRNLDLVDPASRRGLAAADVGRPGCQEGGLRCRLLLVVDDRQVGGRRLAGERRG